MVRLPCGRKQRFQPNDPRRVRRSVPAAGRTALAGWLVNNGSLSVQGSGALETSELSGSGSYTIDPQCNFSVEPLPDAIGGLVPTQIQILGDENAPVAATRVQLKLGSGESFLTTTDGRGCITLWRAEKLDQVDAVALSGGETYSAVILNGRRTPTRCRRSPPPR